MAIRGGHRYPDNSEAGVPPCSKPMLRSVTTLPEGGYVKLSTFLRGMLLSAGLIVGAATAAHAQAFADPAGSGAIVGAVHWIEGTLLGTVATVAAVVAVAVVGFLMLTGRMNWRYGATVILGCFILFGASSIVAGIQATASAGY